MDTEPFADPHGLLEPPDPDGSVPHPDDAPAWRGAMEALAEALREVEWVRMGLDGAGIYSCPHCFRETRTISRGTHDPDCPIPAALERARPFLPVRRFTFQVDQTTGIAEAYVDGELIARTAPPED